MLCVVQFTNSISRIMDVTILILYTLLLIKFQQKYNFTERHWKKKINNSSYQT